MDRAKLITFRVSRRRREMYCGHARLCVCLCVCLSVRRCIIKLCIISTALDVTEGIFAVLYVSSMGLTRFYKTTVFLHL